MPVPPLHTAVAYRSTCTHTHAPPVACTGKGAVQQEQVNKVTKPRTELDEEFDRLAAEMEALRGRGTPPPPPRLCTARRAHKPRVHRMPGVPNGRVWDRPAA